MPNGESHKSAISAQRTAKRTRIIGLIVPWWTIEIIVFVIRVRTFRPAHSL
jgi:hypothetical protein